MVDSRRCCHMLSIDANHVVAAVRQRGDIDVAEGGSIPPVRTVAA